MAEDALEMLGVLAKQLNTDNKTASQIGRYFSSRLSDEGYQITKKPDSKFEIGQMVIVEDDGDDDSCSRVAKFLGKEARVIGICNDIDGDIIVTIHHETLGYLSLQECAFLKVRTEEEKLLDEAVNFVKSNGLNIVEGGYSIDAIKILIAAGWRPNN